jgi:hypothetical protein
MDNRNGDICRELMQLDEIENEKRVNQKRIEM